MPREISAHTTATEQVTYLSWKIENFFDALFVQEFSISGPDIIMPTQPETAWKTYLLSKCNGAVTEYTFRAELLKVPKFEKMFRIKYQLLFQNEEGKLLWQYKGTGNSINSSYTIQETFAGCGLGLLYPFIHDFLVKGNLIMKCRFRVIGCSTGGDVTTEASSENDLKCLSDNFRALYSSKTLSDFTIVVGDKELPVHKCILSSRSPVLAAMFKSDVLEMRDNKLIVEDFDFNIMEAFTLYLYTGQVSELSGEEYFQLYAASDKYALESLKKTCAHKLMNFITVDNVCDVYTLGHYHCDDVLLSAAKTYVSRNVSSVVTSESWTKMTSQNRELAAEMLKASGIV